MSAAAKGSGIASALGNMQHARKTPQLVPAAVSERLDAQTLERSAVRTSGRLGGLDVREAGHRPLPLDGTAKRSHPDYGKRTIYVRDRTHREALRKYEDGGGREFSELVEMLLQEYIGRPNA